MIHSFRFFCCVSSLPTLSFPYGKQIKFVPIHEWIFGWRCVQIVNKTFTNTTIYCNMISPPTLILSNFEYRMGIILKIWDEKQANNKLKNQNKRIVLSVCLTLSLTAKQKKTLIHCHFGMLAHIHKIASLFNKFKLRRRRIRKHRRFWRISKRILYVFNAVSWCW